MIFPKLLEGERIMYNWPLSTAVSLANENFLDSVQIVFEHNAISQPYSIRFKTKCGDRARLVTTHTSSAKRKVRGFSNTSSARNYLEKNFPQYEQILKDMVIEEMN